MSGAGRDIRRTEIAPGIIQFMTMRDSYVRQLNSVVVVNDHDVLVFDTNTRPSSARLILSQIRRITRKPVRYVVNSHGHPDHWSGNQVYADAFPGLEIIATPQTDELMHRMAPVWPQRFTTELANRRSAYAEETRTGHRADGSVPTPDDISQEASDITDYATFVDEATTLRRVFPTLTYDTTLTLQHGGREFRFMSVAGDTEGTTVLYLPKESVLITGDAISYPIPYVSAHPSRQAASLRMLAALNARSIIPGHGPTFHDDNFLLLELALLEEAIRDTRAAKQNGATLEQAQQSVTLLDLRDRFTHGDPDLEQRYTTRVHDLVGFAYNEQAAP